MNARRLLEDSVDPARVTTLCEPTSARQRLLASRSACLRVPRLRSARGVAAAAGAAVAGRWRSSLCFVLCPTEEHVCTARRAARSVCSRLSDRDPTLGTTSTSACLRWWFEPAEPLRWPAVPSPLHERERLGLTEHRESPSRARRARQLFSSTLAAPLMALSGGWRYSRASLAMGRYALM